MSTPVALFIYNRPDHLRRTLSTLIECEGFDDTPVIVFADGPKHADDPRLIEAARAVVTQMLGERATFRFSDTNKGLARSIIDGVIDVVESHGRVIVLEDDLELAPGFLTYMNAALDRYADDLQVYQISGYAFDGRELDNRTTAAFLPFVSTWGWATWNRAWAEFDEAATGWQALTRDRHLRDRFNLGGSYDYATMLERQMAGKRDSWGIRWYWSVFVKEGLTLHPPRTLVRNGGFDGSGTHGRGAVRRFGGGRSGLQLAPIDFPPPVMDAEAYAAVRRAIARQNGGVAGKLVDAAKTFADSILRR